MAPYFHAQDVWERVSGGDVAGRVEARVSGGLLVQNAVELEREETRKATECANAECARPAARTRNVVMITVESLGALYTDLYNPDAQTMPFVSDLYNAALPGSAFLLERIYVFVLRLEPSPCADLHVGKIWTVGPHRGHRRPSRTRSTRSLPRCAACALPWG